MKNAIKTAIGDIIIQLPYHPLSLCNAFAIRLVNDWTPNYVVHQYISPGAPFYLRGLTLIPAWINNYIHYKVWDEITCTVQPLKFGNG